jgi:ribosome biogenesis GTPase / thiamine phosphate phosphatase
LIRHERLDLAVFLCPHNPAIKEDLPRLRHPVFRNPSCFNKKHQVGFKIMPTKYFTSMNSHLLKLGWNEAFQQQLNRSNFPNAIPARIIRENRGVYNVHTGDNITCAQLSGSFRNAAQTSLDLPTIGDWVLVEQREQSQEPTIVSVLERKSLFTRQSSGDRSDNQLLAANIDYLFIVAGLDQEFNPKRIQRYLMQAWNSGAEPVILLNKTDLIANQEEIIAELRTHIMDTPILAISAINRDQIECLHPYLIPGKTVAFSGSSGVGKSSIINALLGEQRLKIQATRTQDNRGRHTTTWRELVILDEGACIIDLPGMRELQLTGEQTGVMKAFSDIQMIIQQCRYRNCQHHEEPGCAIQEALKSGQLTEQRYNQYTKLIDENNSAKKRNTKRKQKENSKPNRWEEKEAFFKDIAIQHRKAKNAKRKFDQQDGF